jgi:hypothetical protein
VSYRHTSYRKMSKAIARANEARTKGLDAEHFGLARHEIDRVLHWSNQPPLPKPFAWGKPKDWRA